MFEGINENDRGYITKNPQPLGRGIIVNGYLRSYISKGMTEKVSFS